MTKELAESIIKPYENEQANRLSKIYLWDMCLEHGNVNRKDFESEIQNLMEHKIIEVSDKLRSSRGSTSETILLLTMPYNNALAEIKKIYA